MNDSSRPRLLYFNGPWDYLGARMRQSFIEPFRRLIEQDFDVVSVEGSCDFRSEVERHRPDAVLFHSGCEAPREPEVTIASTDAFPELPRMGYMFRDPFSPSRMMAINRLRAWGVHQIFSAARGSDSLGACFQDGIYVPWWIDETLFRDYGEEKVLPITLTGAGWLNRCIYTWRRDICMQLLPRFPVFHTPSLGNRETGHDYFGESYVRLLNRSLFSAGCGSVNRYLTLKLLEIPAARCCLIAEETEVLKAMGFRDGVNCVFAEPGNVVAKVQALLDAPERLKSITDAGFALVHERHTARQRRMFFEWYRLWSSRRPGQRVVQTHPIEPLQLVDEGVPAPARTFPDENPLVAALAEGYRLLAARRHQEALAKFEWVIGIVPCVAEARMGAAICLLRLGRVPDGRQHLAYNFQLMTQHFGYRHPDPIDAACLAALLLRLKEAKTAVSLVASYPDVRHPALNAMRWILSRSSPQLAAMPVFQVAEGDESTNVETVHVLPQRRFSEWVALLMEFIR